jgi:large subunit ribosomal protein L3
MKQLITRKIGMTNTINEDGSIEPITLLFVPQQKVSQIKNLDKDGYSAIQVTAEPTKKVSKPQTGHLKKIKFSGKTSRELRLEDNQTDLQLGDDLSVNLFDVDELVNVQSISKGKGFAGTIKRHNFHRGRKTHGGRSYRRPGSIGSMFPQKIFKGKKMAGRMGHDAVTIKNLAIKIVDPELSVIGVKGAVPGPKKSLVLIKGNK